MVKAVLFDLDGTIADSLPAIRRSFEHVIERHGSPAWPDVDVLLGQVGKPLEVVLAQLALSEDLLSTVLSDFREHNRAMLPSVPLFPKSLETLRALKESGLKTGIVTSKNRVSTNLTIATHALEPFCDVIVTKEDSVRHKPDPMPLILATEQLGLSPNETVYVGDAAVDMQAARRAGCLSVAALWGAFRVGPLLAERPDWVAHSICSLPALLGLNGKSVLSQTDESML